SCFVSIVMGAFLVSDEPPLELKTAKPRLDKTSLSRPLEPAADVAAELRRIDKKESMVAIYLDLDETKSDASFAERFGLLTKAVPELSLVFYLNVLLHGTSFPLVWIHGPADILAELVEKAGRLDFVAGFILDLKR